MISKILNWSLYRDWKQRKAGKKVCDYEKGPGYYLPLGLIFVKMIGRREYWEMNSGKRMIVECLDYKKYRDPDDMVKSSKWQYIGYEGEKPFSEYTWDEWLSLHK